MSDTSDRHTQSPSERPQRPGGGAPEEGPGHEASWFRAFFELASIGVVECDVETGRYLYVNDAFCSMTGYSAPELLATTFIEMTHPEDRDPNWAGYREALSAGQPHYRIEKRFVHKDGHPVWARVNVAIIRDAAGRPSRAAALVEDITAHRRAEEALRESEERDRLIVEGALDYAILTTDPEGVVTSWSPGAEAVYGWPAAEAVGQPIAMTFTPEDRADGVPERERAAAREQGFAPDVRRHLRRDGALIFIDGVTRALGDGKGGVRGFLKVGQDVTERRRADEALRRAHDEMEERVDERTRELQGTTGELLIEVRERAEAEDQVRSLLKQLVTVQEEERRRIARELHDTLGQQLAALGLSLDMLRSRAGGGGLREEVERARSILDRLNSDVDFIAWELRPAALDQLGLDAALQTFVREWGEHFGVEADYQGLVPDATRLAPEVEINLYRIAQEALLNVHKHAGAGRVDVLLERRGDAVVLIVEDNGRGYDPGREAGAGGDMGMGVVNMRERAALVGGTLEVESTPGDGTTVFVRVPFRAPPGHGDGKESRP